MNLSYLRPGALVEWIVDLRPLPNEHPEAEAASCDMSLIRRKRGRIVAFQRTLLGSWKVLVDCGPTLVEVDAFDLRLVEEDI